MSILPNLRIKNDILVMFLTVGPCKHVRENELFGHNAPAGKGDKKNFCQVYYLNAVL